MIGGGFIAGILLMYIGQKLGERFPNSIFSFIKFFKSDPSRLEELKKSHDDAIINSQVLFDKAFKDYSIAHDIPVAELPERISDFELNKIKSQAILNYYAKAGNEKLSKDVEEHKLRKLNSFEKKVLEDSSNNKSL